MISRKSDNHIPSMPNGAHHLTPESVLQSAEEAVEAARSFTNQSLDKAGSAMRDVRANMASTTDQLASAAQELARKGIAAASKTSAQAHQTVNRYASATTRYVRDEPVKSALIAVAVGAAVAALVIALRNREDD